MWDTLYYVCNGHTLSQSIPMALRSSQSLALWNPGITRCSRVRVCTIESISSSRVLSLATDGDLLPMRRLLGLLWVSGPCPLCPLRPRPPDGSSRKLSRISVRTGAKVSRYLKSSTLEGERLMLRLYGGLVTDEDLKTYKLQEIYNK